jgi:hypothetical protein
VEAIMSCCLRCIVAMSWCSRKWAACGRGLERVPNFEVWEKTGQGSPWVRLGLGGPHPWIVGESQPLEKRPSLKEETRFGGGSLDRGDVSPNAQVQGEAEGLILARPQLGQGPEEEQNGGGDSQEPEHRSREEEGPQARAWPRAPTAWSRVRLASSRVSAPNVRSTLMGRPNWSQIIKQAGFKQALLRACSRARLAIPKEQGRRSRTGEMATQFLYPGWS